MKVATLMTLVLTVGSIILCDNRFQIYAQNPIPGRVGQKLNYASENLNHDRTANSISTIAHVDHRPTVVNGRQGGVESAVNTAGDRHNATTMRAVFHDVVSTERPMFTNTTKKQSARETMSKLSPGTTTTTTTTNTNPSKTLPTPNQLDIAELKEKATHVNRKNPPQKILFSSTFPSTSGEAGEKGTTTTTLNDYTKITNKERIFKSKKEDIPNKIKRSDKKSIADKIRELRALNHSMHRKEDGNYKDTSPGASTNSFHRNSASHPNLVVMSTAFTISPTFPSDQNASVTSSSQSTSLPISTETKPPPPPHEEAKRTGVKSRERLSNMEKPTTHPTNLAEAKINFQFNGDPDRAIAEASAKAKAEEGTSSPTPCIKCEKQENKDFPPPKENDPNLYKLKSLIKNTNNTGPNINITNNNNLNQSGAVNIINNEGLVDEEKLTNITTKVPVIVQNSIIESEVNNVSSVDPNSPASVRRTLGNTMLDNVSTPESPVLYVPIGSSRDNFDKLHHDILGLSDLSHFTSPELFSTFPTEYAEVIGVDEGNESYSNDSANNVYVKMLHDITWPIKKEAVMEGDIILGGLMMVHEREDHITCGPVMPQGGIQALEAMLYTLDRLNEGPIPLLPNITLGAHILDDCDKDTYGLEMAVDFIKGE